MTLVDYRQIVSRADLRQVDPAWTPGLILGNGRVSALVRVMPHAVRLQIRRDDVFAGGAPSAAERRDTSITLEIDWSSPVFLQGAGCIQRLSLYSAEWSLQGPQVSVRCFTSATDDLLALEIADHRSTPHPLQITLAAGDAPQDREQAQPPYTLQRNANGLTLVQRYATGDYPCVAALAVRAPQTRPQSVTGEACEGSLRIDPDGEVALLLAASAASWSPGDAAGERANALLDGLADATFDLLRREHAARWETFWQDRLGNLLATEEAPVAWLRSLYLERAAPHWRSLPAAALPDPDALLLAPPIEESGETPPAPAEQTLPPVEAAPEQEIVPSATAEPAPAQSPAFYTDGGMSPEAPSPPGEAKAEAPPPRPKSTAGWGKRSRGTRAAQLLPSMLLFAARRLLGNMGLTIGAALSVIVGVSLVVSIPLYADGIIHRLLWSELESSAVSSRFTPFGFRFTYNGLLNGAVTWEEYQTGDAFFEEYCPNQIGLPLEMPVRFAATSLLSVYPAEPERYATAKEQEEEERSAPPKSLGVMSLGFASDLFDHVEIVDGALPVPPASEDEPLEVLVMESQANKIGFSIGEVLFLQTRSVTDFRVAEIPVRVAGVWRPRNLRDPYWFTRERYLETTLMLSEEAFTQRVVPAIKEPVYQATWYLVFDGSGVRSEDVPGLMERITAVRSALNTYLNGVMLDQSPEVNLKVYDNEAELITILLYAFSIPIIGVVLYFNVLTAGLMVQRQRNEIAVLRSRGASNTQILGVYLLQWVILGSIALALSPWLGQAVAQVMGHSRSFLAFEPGPNLSLNFSRLSLQVGLLAALASMVASLLPALSAGNFTITSYQRDVARSLRSPWWQRFFLDFLLLGVALYGYYLLKVQGSIAVLGLEVELGLTESDPFQNPLLFLVPTLFVFALSLMCMRLLPLLMRLLAYLAQWLPGIAPQLALGQLARSWTQYTAPVLLTTLTLGLSCFTASMAQTLDQSFYDRAYYEVGADLRIWEGSESENADDWTSLVLGGAAEAQYYPTIQEHLQIEGVRSATRMAMYEALMPLGGRQIRGRVVGIDRLDFQQTAYFRRDFAPESLGQVLNRLAVHQNAILVPPTVLTEYGLAVGDQINLQVSLGPHKTLMPVMITGVVELFPTIYPKDGPFFIANLDYLFDQVGGMYPHSVLLRTDPTVPPQDIVRDVEGLGIRAETFRDARRMIAGEMQRPERQGTLGLLSVGFLGSALLTAFGFLLYSLLSLRRRAIELGILRPLGLSREQLVAYLSIEQILLIGSGVGAGTWLGVLSSKLFIPFLQVRTGAHLMVPPFDVLIAWGDITKVYIIFGVMLVFTMAGLVALLVRMQLGQAIKLGQTV